jgi:hypothetical protein
MNDEFAFLADVEKTVNKLCRDLNDSPISLKGHLHYWLGVLDGTCNAKNWVSADRQRVFAHISTKIETLPDMKATGRRSRELDEFGIGEKVNVHRLMDDLFDHDFTGTVHSKTDKFVVVEDQDGDCWDCIPDQLSHNTDDIMHG